MRVLSLFSGIGGLCHYGIQLAGLDYKVVQFVESSEYSSSKLQNLFPAIPLHKDIATFNGAPHKYDVIVGGFPCHGTSGAGQRQGLADPRSGLWFEMFRVIKESLPRFVLIENPIGLRQRGLYRIIEDFTKIRYMGEWTSIRASDVGLPHQRERLFIIAYPNGLLLKRPSAWANQIRDSFEEIRFSCEDRSYKPGISKVDDGVPIGVAKNIPGNFDARRALGLSCSPRQSAIAWKRIYYLEGLCHDKYNRHYDIS